ncbi:MAG: hypothetical protein ACTSYB_18800 [Candidatus Helarchaeota archaeon]
MDVSAKYKRILIVFGIFVIGYAAIIAITIPHRWYREGILFFVMIQDLKSSI